MRHKNYYVDINCQFRVLSHLSDGCGHRADPSFTLAQLVRLVYSPDARKRSAASSAVEAVLCGHADQCRTVTVLLDCLRCKSYSICGFGHIMLWYEGYV